MTRETFPSPVELRGALQGTLLYLALYIFVFVQFQSYSKFYLFAQKKKEAKKEGTGKVSWRATKYYNSRDILALAGDRSVGNFVEFAIVFLPLLWLHAIFVDPAQSFAICTICTAARSIHPALFLLNKPPSIVLSTAPGCAVILHLFSQLVFKA